MEKTKTTNAIGLKIGLFAGSLLCIILAALGIILPITNAPETNYSVLELINRLINAFTHFDSIPPDFMPFKDMSGVTTMTPNFMALGAYAFLIVLLIVFVIMLIVALIKIILSGVKFLKNEGDFKPNIAFHLPAVGLMYALIACAFAYPVSGNPSYGIGAYLLFAGSIIGVIVLAIHHFFFVETERNSMEYMRFGFRFGILLLSVIVPFVGCPHFFTIGGEAMSPYNFSGGTSVLLLVARSDGWRVLGVIIPYLFLLIFSLASPFINGVMKKVRGQLPRIKKPSDYIVDTAAMLVFYIVAFILPYILIEHIGDVNYGLGAGGIVAMILLGLILTISIVWAVLEKKFAPESPAQNEQK